MSTDAGWGDYLATDGSSDLSVELSQAADVDQAAASSYADASTDLSYTGGDLPADAGAADAAWDASVNANLAGDSLDSASANQEWADWHGEIASDAISSGNSYVDAANTALEQGDMGMYEYNKNAADIQFDGASDHATYAADYSDAMQSDVSTAASYESVAADSVDAATTAVDAGYDTAPYDTAAYETTSYETTSAVDATSYDTTSYDTSATASYDTTAAYDTSATASYDTTAAYDASATASYDTTAAYDASATASYDTSAAYDTTAAYDTSSSYDTTSYDTSTTTE